MHTPSRLVESTQTGPHPDLMAVLEKHLASEFRKPFADYNLRAYEEARAAWGGVAPLILDAGCGVGESTLHLARQFPDHFVIGVDQSADRLSRNKQHLAPVVPDNLIWVRADLVDFWRLMARDSVRLARHYVLYPNPWPKPHHLMRRWAGHPVFPAFASLGGVIECRSNWRIYCEEFALALDRVLGGQHRVEDHAPVELITPFERKYLASGQALFRVVGGIGHARKLACCDARY